MDYSKTVKAAAVQLSPVLHSQSGTMEKVLGAIGDAAREGVELIVFPETFVPYYPYFSFVLPPVLMGKEHMKLYEEAVLVPGPVTEAVSKAARTHHMVIVLGVNERENGSLYNTQLIFDATGDCVLKRRKLTPTYHERMVWGQGDGSGLQVCETAVGKVGALACWEHYNPLARYSLMAAHEQIHCGQFPGSMVGDIFGEQTEVTMRHHALESGCFVVNSTGWLTPEQVEQIAPNEGLQRVLRGGCYTAIISPEGAHLTEPIREGEGMAIATLDFSLITKRKRMMDSVGHYARPDLLQLNQNKSAYSVTSQASTYQNSSSQTASQTAGQTASQTAGQTASQTDNYEATSQSSASQVERPATELDSAVSDSNGNSTSLSQSIPKLASASAKSQPAESR